MQMRVTDRVLGEVARERDRQVGMEGWTTDHDDQHTCGEMAQAAACYAYPAPWGARPEAAPPPQMWPWSITWWKPKDRRRNLIRAAALIVAEIERMDRAEKRAA